MKAYLLLLTLIFASTSFAQGTADDERSFEAGILTGSYLLEGAGKNFPTIGGRLGYRVNSNAVKFLEGRYFASNTGGVSYHMAELGIRNEFTYEKISALWLLGFDWHFLRAKTSDSYQPKQGWHAGFGLNVKINPKIHFRNDYILRFAGGMSLSVNLGLTWAFDF